MPAWFIGTVASTFRLMVTAPTREEAMQLAARRFGNAPLVAEPAEVAHHTAGPWTVSEVGIGFEVEAADGTVVAQAQQVGGHEKGHAVRRANARLIATAPEALAELVRAREALQHCRLALNYFHHPDLIDHLTEVIAAADAVIRKAS